MIILLCRHGLAADRDDQLYPDDTERPLIREGRREQARMSRRLARRNLIPSAIYSSPWKRAWQTAGVLARETGAGKRRRIACPPLATEPDLTAIAEAVGERRTDEIVALVGHEPWMSELGSLLLAGSPTRLEIDFRKSGIMAIEAAGIGPACGRLRFFWV